MQTVFIEMNRYNNKDTNFFIKMKTFFLPTFILSVNALVLQELTCHT